MASDKSDVSAYDAFKAADDGERISVAELRRQIAEEAEACKDCGRPDGSFACRIRHINIDVSNLKRERER